MRYFKLLATLLFFIPAMQLLAQDFTGLASWTPLGIFSHGADESQLLWYETDSGGILDGPFQGPMSFLTDKNGNLWAGDSLNARISVFDKNWKQVKVFDLIEIAHSIGLATPPMLLEFVPAPDGKILVADVNNNRVIAVDIKSLSARAYPPPASKSIPWSQINRIHSDARGRIYIEDVALMKTVVLNENGRAYCEPLDGEVGLAVSASGHLAMVVMAPSGARQRLVVISPDAKEPFTRVAEIKSDKQILWSAAIGFDQKNHLTVAYDTEDGRTFEVIDLKGKSVSTHFLRHHDPGYDLNRPEWLDAAGNLYTVEAGQGKLKILKLQR